MLKEHSHLRYKGGTGMSTLVSTSDRLDLWDRLSQSPSWRNIQTRLLDFGALPSTAHTLDFLCGSAEESRVLAERVAHVVAYQPNPALLETAHARLDVLPHPRIQLVGGLALDAVCAPDQFDALYSLRMFWGGLPEAAQLAACQQVLKPGGVLVAMLPTQRFERRQLSLMPSAKGMTAHELEAFQALADASMPTCTESQLEKHLLPLGWRRLRTIELLDGLLLGLKTWR